MALVVALCECPTPACDQFVLGTNQCLVANNADPLCSCPTIAKYGPECNECIMLKDPAIGAGVGASSYSTMPTSGGKRMRRVRRDVMLGMSVIYRVLICCFNNVDCFC